MSWSGPGPGAAPFPQPQYPNGRVGKKGNPIITRYPPPPGYRASAQIHTPFDSHPHFRQSHPIVRGYQSTDNNAACQAHSFSQQPYPQSPISYWHQQSPLHQRPLQTYPPLESHKACTNYRPAVHPTNYNQHYNQAQAGLPYSRHPSLSETHVHSAHIGISHSAAPLKTAQYAPFAAQGLSKPINPITGFNASEKTKLFLDWDDWDFDFDGAIWPKSNEPVDPNLSLGVIIWHPAKQVTRALPSTFAGAESQALMPIPEGFGNGESVSIYFTAENSHEAFLDVRQTDDWDYIKTDPIFVEFLDCNSAWNLITLEDCIAQRERPDHKTIRVIQDGDEEMPDAAYSVMDHLELALSYAGESSEIAVQRADRRPQSALQSQEDILTALGVTGVPKPPACAPMTSAAACAFDGHDTRPQVVENTHLPQSSIIQLARQTRTFDSLDSSRTTDAIELHEIGPALLRRYSSSYRKRSFEDAEAEGSQHTQLDDYTRRKRRSQADTVYSRR